MLAFVALVASLVGALGPAEPVRTTYSWPPPTLPSGTPSRIWYTPLLLIRHRPEAISAEVPCTLPPALPGAERPLTVVATARFPERNGGLALTRSGRRLVLSVGRETLERLRLPAESSAGCTYGLHLGGGRWSLEGGPGQITRGGALERTPVVSGLFSALDLRVEQAPRIEVTTAVHASQPILRQTVAWTLAVLCVVVALALVALEGRPQPRRAVRHGVGTVVAHSHPADAVVGFVLLGWWVLSPIFLDDGWVIARERMFSSSGGFSYYYNAFGGNLPNDYWLEWLQHWLSESSLLVLRIPSLLCLAAVWVLCRWILGRVLASAGMESAVAPWALASAFLVGALAWGMTLRPEPVTALFVTAVLACTVRFLEKGTAAPIALMAVLLPLALTAHHAAVAAFAPLLVVAPSLLRWARERVAIVSTVVGCAIALLAVLLFVGSDLEQRRADAETFAAFTYGASWRSESLRYAFLLEFPYGTPLRRASVALMGLAVLAFLLRRRRGKHPLLDLPAASLGLALFLFILTPSKWPWHFGALIGIAALAAATETARLRYQDVPRGWSARPFIAVGAAILAIAWSWWPRPGWSSVDLRTLDWTLGFESVLPLSTLSVALPIVLLAGAVLVALVRASGDFHDAPRHVASWVAPVLAAPLIAFTVGVLAADAAKTDSWTFTRQNLGTLTGDVGCGLADDLLVPDLGSTRQLSTAAGGESRPVPSWVPVAPVEGLSRFASGPAGRGSTRSPWFRLPAQPQVGFFVLGTLASSDRLGLEWGRIRRGRITSLGIGEVAAEPTLEAGSVFPWRFVVAGEMRDPKAGTNLVRITLRRDVTPGAAVATTAPVTYASEPLALMLKAGDESSLVFPSLVTYFPCVRLPQLRAGTVEPPAQIVVHRNAPTPVAFPESPFIGVLDLYRVERLALADSANPPQDVLVFGVDKRIPGAMRVPVREERVS